MAVEVRVIVVVAPTVRSAPIFTVRSLVRANGDGRIVKFRVVLALPEPKVYVRSAVKSGLRVRS